MKKKINDRFKKLLLLFKKTGFIDSKNFPEDKCVTATSFDTLSEMKDYYVVIRDADFDSITVRIANPYKGQDENKKWFFGWDWGFGFCGNRYRSIKPEYDEQVILFKEIEDGNADQA